MKQLFLVANWKSFKTTVEAKEWFKEISNIKYPISNKTIIVCPPLTLLQQVSELIKQYNLPFLVGAQDVSPYGEGRYTGAVNAMQIKEFAEYVLIGHSERKQWFHETDEMLAQKVTQAHTAGLQSIFFMQDTQTPVPEGVDILVYEPPSAISGASGGIPENPDAVEKAILEIKQKYPSHMVLYGGSVNAENVNEFTKREDIDGVVPGQASLDPTSFAQLITNA